MAKFTKEKITGCLKGSALTLATLFGVIGGVIFGLCLRQREGKYYMLEIFLVCLHLDSSVLGTVY